MYLLNAGQSVASGFGSVVVMNDQTVSDDGARSGQGQVGVGPQPPRAADSADTGCHRRTQTHTAGHRCQTEPIRYSVILECPRG